LVLDAGGASGVEHDAANGRARLDLEVAAVLDRMQERVRRAPAAASLLGDLHHPGALLRGAVEVVGAPDADRLGRLDEERRERAAPDGVGDVQFPVLAMELVAKALVV